MSSLESGNWGHEGERERAREREDRTNVIYPGLDGKPVKSTHWGGSGGYRGEDRNCINTDTTVLNMTAVKSVLKAHILLQIFKKNTVPSHTFHSPNSRVRCRHFCYSDHVGLRVFLDGLSFLLWTLVSYVQLQSNLAPACRGSDTLMIWLETLDCHVGHGEGKGKKTFVVWTRSVLYDRSSSHYIKYSGTGCINGSNAISLDVSINPIVIRSDLIWAYWIIQSSIQRSVNYGQKL